MVGVESAADEDIEDILVYNVEAGVGVGASTSRRFCLGALLTLSEMIEG